MKIIYCPSLQFYVYAYLRTDGTPYYIGKGKNGRAYDKRHSVNLPKDKNRIIFLEKNLTNTGALALERFYIRWYGRKDLGTGILRNITDGGESNTGAKFSSEHRAKIRAAQTGKKHSPETRAKMSAARKGIPKKKGRILSFEHRAKIRAALTGKKHSPDRIEANRKGQLSRNRSIQHQDCVL